MSRRKQRGSTIHTASSNDQLSGNANKSSFFVGILSISLRTACFFSSCTWAEIALVVETADVSFEVDDARLTGSSLTCGIECPSDC